MPVKVTQCPCTQTTETRIHQYSSNMQSSSKCSSATERHRADVSDSLCHLLILPDNLSCDQVNQSQSLGKQEHPALTFSCSGTQFGSRLLAYIRYTLRSSTWSRIFWQSRSAALLEGAQARMWQEAWVFSICLMASTRVTVLPEQTKSDQNKVKCNKCMALWAVGRLTGQN